MGGTFDPIHLGHLAAASEVHHAFQLDRMVFVPAGEPWQKKVEAPAEDRLMMTTLAVAGHRHLSVSRIEIDRRGPTYTTDTFEALRSFYGEDALFFLVVGADAVLNLKTWKKLDRLAELVEIVAVSRPGSELEGFEPVAGLPRVHVHEMPALDVSGTDIRARVRQGKPIDVLVPSTVATYIREHGLYVDATREISA